MLVLYAGLGLGFLKLLGWSLDGGEDVVHIAVAIACMLFLGIGMMKASAAKNRPYKVEEHTRDYYARIKMATEMNDVDCRLRFNETGYEQLTGILNFFNGRACA